MDIREIEVDQITISASNVRNDANETNGDADTSIEDLAQSILSRGLINPISVRPKTDSKGFEVIAGQRRLAAFRMLNRKKIPCSVVSEKMTDNEAVVHSLVENFQRQDNSYKDKVKAFSMLLKDHCAGDISKLCKLVGVQKKTAERYVAMQSLPVAVIETLDANVDGKRLTLSSATSLLKVPEYQQAAVASVLVGRSGAESQIIIDQIRQMPSLTNPVEIVGAVKDIISNHALSVAIDANLVAERSWRSDHPWIHCPHDTSKVYAIHDINKAWDVLQSLNLIHRVHGGENDRLVVNKKRSYDIISLDDDF